VIPNSREITVPPGLAPMLASPAHEAPPGAPPAKRPDPADNIGDLENERTVLAPRKSRAEPTAEPTGPTWVLVTPAGTRESISGIVVVGRQPAKTAFKGSDRSLVLKDSDSQVSKSHAVFDVDDAGLWVRDLGSTNGVVVIAPSGEDTEVTGDDRVAVPAGAEVELGGYVLTVERGA
jgi:pSer/pThr/pTyr-binding forkhead associated (FHA) protein